MLHFFVSWLIYLSFQDCLGCGTFCHSLTEFSKLNIKDKWCSYADIFCSVPIKHTYTQIPGRKEPDNHSPFWLDIWGPLWQLPPPPSPSAYQPPTGQVLARIRRGPQTATSPLSQLSLDFSEQKPLLSENLKRCSDKAEELPESDPCVYLAAAWQSPIPTVEAVRASHTSQPSLPPHLSLIMYKGSQGGRFQCSFNCMRSGKVMLLKQLTHQPCFSSAFSCNTWKVQ